MVEEEDKSKGKKRFTKEFVDKWTKTTEEEKSPEEAILEKQKKLLEKDPKSVRVWYANGLLLMDMTRNEDALKSFDRVIEIDPGHAGVWNARAEVLRRLGRTEEAAESLKKALEHVAPNVDERFRQIKGKPESVEDLLKEVEEESSLEEKPPEEMPDILEELEALGGEVAEPEEKSPEERKFREKMAVWEAQGYDVKPLMETLENEPYKARTAFFQFEQSVGKIVVLKVELDKLKAPGFEDDINRLREEMRSPTNMWKIEADMGDLLSRIESAQRVKKEVEERREEEAEAAAAILPPMPPGPKPPTPRPLAPAKVPPLRTAEGRTNGLAKGKGRITGAGLPTGRMSGTGRTNGLVNGLTQARQGLTNGLTNGNGFTNGLGSSRFRRDARMRRWKILIIPVLAAAMLLVPLLSVPPSQMPPVLGGVTIDGNAADWSGVPGYTQKQAVPDDNVNLTSYKMLLKDGLLSFLVEMKGNPFTSVDGYDSVYAFIDADGVASTGYDLGGFGADYMIEVSGTNGSVMMSTLHRFDSTNPGGNQNWSAWSAIDDVNRAFSGSVLEFQVDTSLMGPSGVVFSETGFETLLETDNNRGATVDTVVKMGAEYGALIVHQQGGPDSVDAVSSAGLLTLAFEAIGSSVHVNSVAFSKSTQTTIVDTPSNFDVLPDQQPLVTRVVSVDTQNVATGDTVSLEVSSVDANRPVTIAGEPAKAYVGPVPAAKRIDGIFSDWSGDTKQTNSRTVWPASLDIVNYATAKSGNEAFYYVDVRGSMMAGSEVVQSHEVAPPSLPSPPSTSPPPGLVKGADVMRVYIDSNSTDNKGLQILGLPGADYMIEIKGIRGRIIQRTLYTWRNERWQQPTAATAEKDEKRMEIGFALSGIDVNTMQVAFESSNWKAQADYTQVTSVRSRTRGVEDTTYETLYGVNLPNEMSPGALVRYIAGGKYVEWSLPDQIIYIDEQGVHTISELSASSLVAWDGGARYGDAYAAISTDVTYTVEDMSLKEQFVINKPLDPLLLGSDGAVRFSFPMKVDPSLIVYINGSGPQEQVTTSKPISFMDGREERFSIPSAMAWDSNGHSIGIPYVWEKAGPTLAIDVPASFIFGASYPLYVDPWVNYTIKNTGPNQNGYGNGEQLGYSVAIGDFNNDGYADLLTGAPFHSNSSSTQNYGAAYIYLGPLTSNKTTPSVSFPGTCSACKKGWAVAAGKFNNDNYWDALVTQYPNQAAYIYYGRSSWPVWVTSANVTINNQGSGSDGFGKSAGAGNVDGNYYDDVIIGEPGKTNVAFNDGAAFVFLSPFPATVTTINYTLLPQTNATGLFGNSIATGLIDSDSKYDVVIGEPTYSGSLGRVDLFKGSRLTGSNGNRMPNQYVTGQQTGERFGWSVAVGNLDSNSYADIAVGAPYNGLAGSHNGKVYIYLGWAAGITTGQAPNATVVNQSTGEEFGTSVWIGPVAGPTTPCLVVGAPIASAGGTARGSAYVFESPLTSSTPAKTQSGYWDSENLGWSLAGGKFANDDFYRLVIGAIKFQHSGFTQAGRVVVLYYIPEFEDMVIIIVSTVGIILGMAYRRKRESRRRG